jgi:hypothetical protein
MLALQLIKNADSLLLFYRPLPQELRSQTDGAVPAVISISSELTESTSTLTGDRVLYQHKIA